MHAVVIRVFLGLALLCCATQSSFATVVTHEAEAFAQQHDFTLTLPEFNPSNGVLAQAELMLSIDGFGQTSIAAQCSTALGREPCPQQESVSRGVEVSASFGLGSLIAIIGDEDTIDIECVATEQEPSLVCVESVALSASGTFVTTDPGALGLLTGNGNFDISFVVDTDVELSPFDGFARIVYRTADSLPALEPAVTVMLAIGLLGVGMASMQRR
jgi:hypothetical protein